MTEADANRPAPNPTPGPALTSAGAPSLGAARAAPALSWLSAWTVTLGVIGLLTAIRLVVNFNSLINLYPDEAQYWAWSRTFEFGYFSKPPMIAWLIALTTVFSDAEGFVRLASPLLHGGTALLVFVLARMLYDARTGAWAAITYATLPGISLSAGIISTDVPLLFIWGFGLIALEKTIRAHESKDNQRLLAWGAATGIAIGAGLLAKYSMSYFVVCGAAYVAFSRQARAAFFTPAGILCVVMATIAFSPNLIWNAGQGFATVEHTAANANWQGNLFNPDKLAAFFVSQFGVFGPLLMVILVFGILTLPRRIAGEYRRADVFLLCFALPILTVALGQAFISRANANWAAPAYVSATIVVVSWLLRMNVRWLLRASLIIHLFSATTLYAAATVPGAIEALALTNTFKRLRGWDVLAAQVKTAAQGAPYTAIMGDDRFVVAELTYYSREAGLPILMWDADGIPKNHFEAQVPYRASAGTPVLYVSLADGSFGIRDRFTTVELVGRAAVPRGGNRVDTFYLFRLDGYLGDVATTPQG